MRFLIFFFFFLFAVHRYELADAEAGNDCENGSEIQRHVTKRNGHGGPESHSVVYHRQPGRAQGEFIFIYSIRFKRAEGEKLNYGDVLHRKIDFSTSK